MRHLFLPACFCLVTMSSPSGFDVGGPLDSTYTDKGRAFVRVTEVEATTEDLSARTDANDTTAEGADDSAEKNGPAEPGDNPADADAKPDTESKPPIEKHVVHRTRREICDAVVTTAHTNDLPVPFFIRLLFQESGFKADVVSRAGAQGIAQFMPDTAATVGLHNPFDPLQAIEASARLLADLARQFGNLGLAAAAYNAGPRRIQDWLAKKGKLPEETQHYVRTITGRAPESWSDREPGALAATLPREAPCQEVVADLAARRGDARVTPREAKRRVTDATPAHGGRKPRVVSEGKTPTIMVAEKKNQKNTRVEDRPKADRKRKGAIQLAASSRKRHRDVQLSRR